MNCDKAMELLALRLDGALTETEERELEAHLAACPACRAAGAQLAALRSSFHELEETSVPEGFAKGVMDRIRTEKKVLPLFRRGQWKALAGLAACTALAVGLYGVSAGRNTNQDALAAAETLQDVGPMGGSTLIERSIPEAEDEVYGAALYSDSAVAVCDGAYDVEAPAAEPAERFSDRAVLILERMPEGAEALITEEPGAVTVVYNTITGEEGYQWWSDGAPEALARIERLAIEQGISAERSSAPAEEAQYDLVLLEPAH